MIHVYHWDITKHLADDSMDANDVRFKMGFRPDTEGIKQFVEGGMIKYIKVASVNTNNLDLAYERTNSIDNAWYDNVDGETLIRETNDPCRSSMCGDILVVDGEPHRAWLVASIGFTAVDPQDFIK